MPLIGVAVNGPQLRMPLGQLGIEIRNAAYRNFFEMFRIVQGRLALRIFPFMGAIVDEGN